MFSNEPAIRDDGAHVVVMLRGELDIANAADLGTVLSEAVARNPGGGRRVLALPFLAGVFPVDASVDEAARKRPDLCVS